jgi:hypothetical protein
MQVLMILQLIGLKKRTVANKEVVCRHEFIHLRCFVYILNLISVRV